MTSQKLKFYVADFRVMDVNKIVTKNAHTQWQVRSVNKETMIMVLVMRRMIRIMMEMRLFMIIMRMLTM